MKNLIVVVASIFILSVIAWAAKSDLPRDFSGQKLQVHSPDSEKTVQLTAGSQTINMSEDLSWSAAGPSDCSYRTMSSATKTGALKPLYGGSWHTRGVKPGSAFTNYTGCVDWIVEPQ